MPKVQRKDIDTLNAVLTVTVGKEDYIPKFNEELKKVRNKAQIKGFRKGQTPVSFLKKMYGKSLMGEIVTDMLQKELSEALSDKATTFLGKPIPSEDHVRIDFNVNEPEDYEFRFDVGKAPDFEIIGADENARFEIFKVAVPEGKVEEQLLYARKRQGLRSEADDLIQEADLVTFDASELDGEAPKTDGWKTIFGVLVERIADEKVKQELLTKKKGDTIRFNIYELENAPSREYVKKYFLHFTETDIEEGTETGEMYEATIQTVNRLAPAELNQEFFDAYFGEGEVNSEEEARERIRKDITRKLDSKASVFLFREMRKRLVDLNRDVMPLPDDFLKRWIKATQPEEERKMLSNYERFADDLRWSLIKNKLADRFEITIEANDLQEAAFRSIIQYFGTYLPWKEMNTMVERMLQNEEQVNSLASGVVSDKVFLKLKETVQLEDIFITEEELNQKLKVLQEEDEKLTLHETSPHAGEEEE
jgi:trigger factor